ncbi:MAG TPA: GreA/GreB family elongation factor [Kiritimatiellia bacterium]|nr:GreA/GreB family elongation factor [Kiritimatiellia bacterium]
MQKAKVVLAIVEALKAKVALHAAAARTAHEEATHEENRAEDKYDTRGLEASYLAAGQVRQTAEVAEAIREYANVFLKKFKASDPIDVTALVEMSLEGKRTWYFIGPAAGGLEVEVDGVPVLVLTPQSPLAQAMTGKKKGGTVVWKVHGLEDRYKIVSVQ